MGLREPLPGFRSLPRSGRAPSENTGRFVPGQLPVVPYLTNARAGALLEANTSFVNSALEYDVRLFHWRALNHARREWRDKRSRAWHEQGCWIDPGDRERDRLINEIAYRLLPLLETAHPRETLLLGELHRILGHPDRDPNEAGGAARIAEQRRLGFGGAVRGSLCPGLVRFERVPDAPTRMTPSSSSCLPT